MKDDLGLKLIAVVGMRKVKLFAAKGIKIIEQLEDCDHDVDKHHRGEKKQSHCHQRSACSSSFQPHTQPKDIEHNEAARFVVSKLDDLVLTNKYKELIIAAEPRMLGFIRQNLTSHIKKLEHREIHKEFISYTKAQLEEAIFGTSI